MEFQKSPHLEKCLLDEQMYLSDPQTALLFHIREEIRELNHSLKQLFKPPEEKKIQTEKKVKKNG